MQQGDTESGQCPFACIKKRLIHDAVDGAADLVFLDDDLLAFSLGSGALQGRFQDVQVVFDEGRVASGNHRFTLFR